MPESIIQVKGLSKTYSISQKPGYLALRDLLAESMKRPFKGRGRRASKERFWALRDVSFEVKRGEVVGVIGRNGAGKTTLLKLLSRITYPVSGEICLGGRVGSLLEVGTGFHSELTGRENIYFNGAILGMKKREIDRKFDEMVEFSGVEKFLDMPVKRYSSGMQVRLAFSVAAHLEPEILLVDEVLAVGDVQFQKKCLGKMKDVSQSGRTILFVSHNMAAVASLCKRAILIEHGRLLMDVDTQKAVSTYLDRNTSEGAAITSKGLKGRVEGVIKKDNPTIQFKEVAVLDQNGNPRNSFSSEEPICLSVAYECLTQVSDLQVIIHVVNAENELILATQNQDSENHAVFSKVEPGIYNSRCTIPPNLFGQKRFYATIHLRHAAIEHLILDRILFFDVTFSGYNDVVSLHRTMANTYIRPKLRWETGKVNNFCEALEGST
ncbi:MAG: ABC transporter ATP-binding protein [Candidatus Omnitrophica bacterium]|nr:ABC transporter ATP-binding protein [Candidatus Omnitrophota bacterium]